MLQTLQKHFGYDSFLPLQEDVVRAFLEKKDVVALMPTGAGKSLCFQLPALHFDGITVVISPLISLMKDQVDALTENGVSATFLNSSIDGAQLRMRMQRIEKGEYKLVYMAPERLAVPNFLEWLKRVNVAALAVDEAHCISQWGHDFRPDYRNLRFFREHFPHTPIIALTATATPKVREDIISQLMLTQPSVFQSSFYRKNLTLQVIPKRNEISKIINLCNAHRGESSIVYCFSRKDTQKLAEILTDQGFSAAAYHAGLEPEARAQVQERFLKDEIDIIVATIAFGMGIDKSNVRMVIHRTFPKTMEGYYQEIGRAGRDGLTSECIMLFSAGDKIKLDYFLREIQDREERESEEKKVLQVIQFAESRTCRWVHLLEYFEEVPQIEECETCDVCTAGGDTEDATEITQKIISGVLKTGERFGRAYVINVLRGSSEKRILQNSHETLSVWGSAKGMSVGVLSEVFLHIVAQGLVAKSDGEYPTFFVTQKGKDFLKNKDTIRLPKVQEEEAEAHVASVSKPIRTRTGGDTVTEYDEDCFEMLRALRKELADKRKVPAFVIFSDVSLREMAHYLPTTVDEFLNITGVGPHKQKKFGKTFMQALEPFNTKR